MPFTEEQVTEIATKWGEPAEVVKKVLAQDEKDAGVIAFLGKVKASVFMPEVDFNARIENEKTLAKDAGAKERDKAVYGTLDKRIQDDTGVEKKPNEKSTDYAARAFKEKFGSKVDVPEEVKRLTDELRAKNDALTSKETELVELRNSFDSEKTTNTINSKLDAVINAISIAPPTHLKDTAQINEYTESQREFLKHKLGQAYKIELVEGKLKFTDKLTGKEVRDNQRADLMNEKQVIEVFAPKWVIIKEVSGKRGTGFQESPLDLSNLDSAQFAQYATVKELREHLTASGVELTSQAAMQKLNEYVDWKGKQK